MSTLYINQFHIDDLKLNSLMFVCGDGTTMLIKNILYSLRNNVDFCVAVDRHREFKDCIPELFIYSDYDPGIIQRLKYTTEQKGVLLLHQQSVSKEEIDKMLTIDNLTVIISYDYITDEILKICDYVFYLRPSVKELHQIFHTHKDVDLVNNKKYAALVTGSKVPKICWYSINNNIPLFGVGKSIYFELSKRHCEDIRELLI